MQMTNKHMKRCKAGSSLRKYRSKPQREMLFYVHWVGRMEAFSSKGSEG